MCMRPIWESKWIGAILIELWTKYGKKCQVALELFKANVTQMGKNLTLTGFLLSYWCLVIGFDKGEETSDLVRLEMTNSGWKMKFIQMNCAPVACLLRLLWLFCALFKRCIYYHEEWDTRKWVCIKICVVNIAMVELPFLFVLTNKGWTFLGKSGISKTHCVEVEVNVQSCWRHF